jgi:hypothetical protein
LTRPTADILRKAKPQVHGDPSFESFDVSVVPFIIHFADLLARFPSRPHETDFISSGIHSVAPFPQALSDE